MSLSPDEQCAYQDRLDEVESGLSEGFITVHQFGHLVASLPAVVTWDRCLTDDEVDAAQTHAATCGGQSGYCDIILHAATGREIDRTIGIV